MKTFASSRPSEQTAAREPRDSGGVKVSVRAWAAALCLLSLTTSGCRTAPPAYCESCMGPLPRELSKVTMPEHVIEAPDILLINSISAIPLSPHRIEPLDSLAISLEGVVLQDEPPFAGVFIVDPDGTINLGPKFGTLKVVGLTLPAVKAALEKDLNRFANLKVSVALAQTRASQQLRGEHLVRPDGSVHLGEYGDVRVAGMTLAEAKWVIESKLSLKLQKPQVTVDVAAYNSKKYYVILDGGGSGQQIVSLPIMGGETVLDAIAQVNGLSPVSSKHYIWVARPAQPGMQEDQILPVDWNAVTARGQTGTNFQLFPGDRVYVQSDRLVAVDTRLGRITAPLERIFGFSLLGMGVVRQAQQFPANQFNNNGFGNNFIP